MKSIVKAKREASQLIYNQLCKFSDWLQRKLYGEYTWQELDQKCIQLEITVEELQDELQYFRDEELARSYRRLA